VDNSLAKELLDRYVARLIVLARKQLSNQVARRVDPEDVVQSAMRSFFRRAHHGQYQWDGERELWNLLAKITVRKVTTNERRHRAQCRDVHAEAPSTFCSGGPLLETIDRFPSREPDPQEASAALEDFRLVMSSLPPLYRRILDLRLQGHAPDRVAALAHCSERTVFRACERCRESLEKRFEAVEE